MEEKGLKKWGTLVVTSLALLIIVIDTTLLNVSISVLIKDLHATIQSIQWVITAYALTLAALTITGGRLGDLFGRKKMFMLGAAIFAVGSFLASIAHSVPTMIVGESIIEGVGAALMMPSTASLIIAKYKGHDRAIAFGVWGGFAAIGSAIGPLLGGWLTSNYSWRWGFRINVFVVILLLLGSVFIKESIDEEEKKGFDFVGVFLSAIGLLSFVFGLIESSTYGWWKAKDTFSIAGYAIKVGSLSITPIAILVGIIFTGLFILWEKRREDKGHTPLVSVHLFQNYQFVSGALTTGLISLSMAGMVFILPVFLQSVKGLDAFHTGLAMLPISLGVLVAAPLAGNLTKRIPAKYLVMAGLFINLLAIIILRWSLGPDISVSKLIPGLALFGFGIGAVMGPINNLTLSSVSVQQAGEASGVNNTFRQIGQSFGAAIIGAVLLSSVSANLRTEIKANTVIPETAKTQIIENLTKPNNNVEFGGATVGGQELSRQTAEAIAGSVRKSTTKANEQSFEISGFFSMIGLIVAMFLPDVQDLEARQKHATAAGVARAENTPMVH
jgi:EmrB/QacA subfamily drug resistance transporter